MWSRDRVSSAIIKGEFAENAEKLVNDGIHHIKQNTLHRRRELIIRKLQAVRGADSVDDVQLMNNLLNEKLFIDRTLAELKELT